MPKNFFWRIKFFLKWKNDFDSYQRYTPDFTVFITLLHLSLTVAINYYCFRWLFHSRIWYWPSFHLFVFISWSKLHSEKYYVNFWCRPDHPTTPRKLKTLIMGPINTWWVITIIIIMQRVIKIASCNILYIEVQYYSPVLIKKAPETNL